MSNHENNKEIQIFCEYLKIPSVHPNVDYEPCLKFLERQAISLSLKISVHYPSNPKKPCIVLTWPGKDVTKSSIILNSHMDVVPVYEEYWTHPPFGAEIDSEGRIFARGTQDMKSVGMQYLGAIRALKREGISLLRTVHVVFVPDEEIGAADGMMAFVKTKAFTELNVGFSLDEGIASPDDVFPIFYAERTVWRIDFKCYGTTGHGSLLHKDTAGEKIRILIDKFMDFRAHEMKRLENNPEMDIGEVTTINLTKIHGGVQSNVVPPLIVVSFDIRIAIDVDHNQFEEMIKGWCREAGDNIEISFEAKKPKVKPTSIDDTNPYWVAFEQTIVRDLKLQIKPTIFPGRTDSCFIRELGIPAIGFSPMNNTPVLLHDNDEFIKAETYLDGIEIYKKLIVNLANC